MAEFVKVAKKSEVPSETGKCVEVKGKEIALFKVGGKVYAMDHVCQHQGGPLAEGGLEGAIVTCPWHGWQYDVTTGQCSFNPSVKQESFKVKEEGEEFLSKFNGWPQRIVCLTAETTEILFALGAGDRIVGVSGYAVRPPEARLKEKVSAFTSARMEKIRVLKPDLIFAFSDLQKDIVRNLTEAGYTVFVTNQRSLQEVGEVICATGRLLGLGRKAEELAEKFFAELGAFEQKAREFPRRLRVYFEEWDDPLISGIRWVGELIRMLGGEDVFEELEAGKVARERRVDPEEVVRRNPEVILASWCGKKVQIEKIRSRAGWDPIEAVQRNQIYEIKSADILQPGLSLLNGARQIFEIFRQIHTKFSLPLKA